MCTSASVFYEGRRPLERLFSTLPDSGISRVRFSSSLNHFEILQELYDLMICVFVCSSNWGPLPLYLNQYPRSPPNALHPAGDDQVVNLRAAFMLGLELKAALARTVAFVLAEVLLMSPRTARLVAQICMACFG